MSGTETVFRSNHPDVLTVAHQWRAEREAMADAVLAIKAEVGDRDAFISRSFSDHSLAYLAAKHDEPVPAGLRYSPKAGGWVPDKRTKAGKAWAARWEQAKAVNLFKILPGMPTDWWPMLHGDDSGDGRVFHPGAREMDGYLYVTWGCALPPGKVDADLWEPVPLSRYYAAVEAREAAKAAS